MNVYLHPLVSPEFFFFLIGIVVITLVGVVAYNPEKASVDAWGTPIPPRATMAIGVLVASLAVASQVTEVRLHLRAQRMECERYVGPVTTRVFSDRRGGRVELTVADRTFALARNGSDARRILNGIESGGRSRTYAVCVGDENRILRVDRVPR